MVTVDADFPDVRARLVREARASLAPLIERIVRDAEARIRGALTPVLDVEHWSGPYASALADVGGRAVADIGERVTRDLGGIVDERAAAKPWSPRGTVQYIAEIALAMSEGEMGQVAARLETAGTAANQRDVLRRAREWLEGMGEDMTNAAARFAAYDAGERAGATQKRWRVNSGNPRSSHAAVSGNTVDFSANFSNGMPYPRGPSPDGAAGVANCECSMVIIKEDS